MPIDFGWILILAGLAGCLPAVRALLVSRRLTRVRGLRLILHAILLLLGLLEVQRHRNWHPLRPSPAQSYPVAALVAQPPAA